MTSSSAGFDMFWKQSATVIKIPASWLLRIEHDLIVPLFIGSSWEHNARIFRHDRLKKSEIFLYQLLLRVNWKIFQ